MTEPWLVLHGNHRAWAQRAFMIGDFAPGQKPTAWYIVDSKGRWADPQSIPTCETCGVMPSVEALVVVEVATGIKDFLARARNIGRWPRPTDPKTCWACNCPGTGGLLCSGCIKHLGRR